MIIANTEALLVNQDSRPLPFKMAVQDICPVDSLESDRWCEFLVRGSESLARLTPFQLVERGYGRRGLLFDEDIVSGSFECIEWLNPDSWVSINIHPGSLSRKSFGEFIKRELEHFQLDPARLILEVVEFDGPVNLMASRPIIEDLRKLGVRFALDDFGPGFSNLDLVASQLVDFVKIDRSLIRFLDSDQGHVRLIQGLQALAEQTGVELVAEGVESQDQVHILQQIGISWLQGFAYSRPKLVEIIQSESELGELS